MEHILDAYELAPCDAGVCFLAATVNAELGQTDEAFAKLVRTTNLDAGFFSDAVHICIYKLREPQLALDLAGDSVHRLSLVASVLSEEDSENELVDAIGVMIKDQLTEIVRDEDNAPAYAFASLAALQSREGAFESAISNYEKALIRAYDQVLWRYRLAKLLQKMERYDEATHQARICLRIKPGFKQAKKLIGELNLAPASDPQP